MTWMTYSAPAPSVSDTVGKDIITIDHELWREFRDLCGELPVPGRMAHLVDNAAECVTVLMFR